MRRRRLRPHGRSAGFAPRLEALEDRCLPAGIFTQLGGLLLITGTSGPDDIRIGDAGTGQISVLSGLQTNPQIFNNVTRIRVRTLGGNDSVHYDLLGTANTPRSINVDLGAGNDRFVAFLNGNALGAGADYRLAVNGGAGDDRLRFDTGNDPNRTTVAQLSNGLSFPFAQNSVNGAGPPRANIDLGAALRLALNGGSGNDTITVNYEGTLAGSPSPTATPFPTGLLTNPGTLTVLTSGGSGDDVIATSILADANSGGRIVAREFGGPGNDDLTLAVRQQVVAGLRPTFPFVDALLDGGPGFNRCRRTPNVTARNCQIDVLLPAFVPGFVTPLSGPTTPA